MSVRPVGATSQVIVAYNSKQAVICLRAILKRHLENTDTLSIKLFRWGATVLQTAHSCKSNQEEKGDEDETIHNIAREKIAVLVHKILVNPIDNSPLKEPILERGITWESWTHRDYKALFSISPIDGGEMLENPPPHFFAKEMIQWAQDFTPPAGTPALAHFPGLVVSVDHSEGRLIPAQAPMQALAKNPLLAGIRPWIYLKLAQNAVLIEQNRTLQEEMERTLERVDQYVVEMQQKTQIVIAGAMQRAQEHEEEVRARIGSIDQIHKKALTELHEQMAWIEQTHQERVSTLEERMASMGEANAAVAGSLKAQIAAMNQEHQTARTVLQNLIHSMNEAQRSSVAMLESKISRADATMSSMVQSHQTEVSHMKEKQAHSAVELQQAHQLLHQERQQNANNAAEIHNLRNANARQQREIAYLNEVVDEDDGFCVIA